MSRMGKSRQIILNNEKKTLSRKLKEKNDFKNFCFEKC